MKFINNIKKNINTLVEILMNEISDNKELLKLFIAIIKEKEKLNEENLRKIKEQLLDNGKLIIGGGILILPGSIITLPIIKLIANKLKINLEIKKTFEEKKELKKNKTLEYNPLKMN